MSIKLMSRVWELKLDHAEQSVLLALADHSADDGSSCYPGILYLAWKTDYSKRQVIRILQRLASIGVIQIIKQRSRHNPTHYKLQLDQGIAKPAFDPRSDILAPKLKGDKAGSLEVTNPNLEVTKRASRSDKSGIPTNIESCNRQKKHKRNIAAKASSLFSSSFPVPYPNSPSPDTVKEIFDHWRDVCSHPHARLDEARFDAIVWALQWYTPEQIKFTCYGYASDAWAQGMNDDQMRHDDIKLICSDAEHVERFLDGFYEERKAN